MKTTEYILKTFGYLFAIAGVIAYRELPQWWHLTMWVPIVFGFSIAFGGFTKE